MKTQKEKIFYAFAVFDVIVLAIYLIKQVTSGRIPFWDDFFSMKELLAVFEDSFLATIPIATLFILNIVLYLSLTASAYYFFKQINKVKWLVLAQTPVRVLVTLTTVPFLLTGYKLIMPSAVV